MEEKRLGNLAIHFADLEDPRRRAGRRHRLVDIVTIAVCATICGADNWVTVASFGQAKEGWFRTFLALEHGIPSHDTFRRVFGLLDKEQFQAGYMAWIAAIVRLLPGQVVAVDGETARAAHDGREASSATHMVTAWASSVNFVL